MSATTEGGAAEQARRESVAEPLTSAVGVCWHQQAPAPRASFGTEGANATACAADGGGAAA